MTMMFFEQANLKFGIDILLLYQRCRILHSGKDNQQLCFPPWVSKSNNKRVQELKTIKNI
jgi:hypothetical protein